MKYIGYSITALVFLAIGACLGGYLRTDAEKEMYNSKVALYKPWFNIPDETKKKLMSNYVAISTDKSAGSGCKIKPGYYLTALHVITDSILNDTTIAVNDQRARIVAHSNTDEDIAVVSTFAEFSKEDATLNQYNEFEDDQDVIIVGNSGGSGAMVQPAKIMRDALNELGYKKTTGAKVITGQYIDHGISGGCVYSADGEKLLGIVTKKYESNSIGEVAPVSRSLK